MALNFTVNFLSGIPIPDYQDIGDSLPVINKAFDDLDTRILMLSTNSEQFQTLHSMISSSTGGTTYFLPHYLTSIPEDYIVFVGGIKQRPYIDYTINNSLTSIVFSSGIPTGLSIEVIRGIGIVPSIEDPTKLSRTGGALTGDLSGTRGFFESFEAKGGIRADAATFSEMAIVPVQFAINSPAISIIKPNSNYFNTANLEMFIYGDSAPSYNAVTGGMFFKRAGGTNLAPTATLSGRTSYIVNSTTSDGINWKNSSAINFGLEDAIVSDIHKSYISFETLSGSDAPSQRKEQMRITHRGNVGIGTLDPTGLTSRLSAEGRSLHIYNNTNDGTSTNSNTVVVAESVNRSAYFLASVGNNGGLSVKKSSDGTTLGRVIVDENKDTIFQVGNNSNGLNETVRILSGGNVGIGTSSPTEKLHVAGNFLFNLDPNARIHSFYDTGVKGPSIQMNGVSGAYIDISSTFQDPLPNGIGDYGLRLGTFWNDSTKVREHIIAHNMGPLYINRAVNNSVITSMVITTAGNIGIGTINPTDGITIARDGNCQLNLDRNSTNASPSWLVGTKRRGTDSAKLSVLDEDKIFSIQGYAYDGTADRHSATIAFEVDRTPEAGSVPGRLVFSTAPSGSSTTPIERVRINAEGNVGIGTSNPTSKLTVIGDISATGTIFLNVGDAANGFFVNAVCFINGATGTWTAPSNCYSVRVTLVGGGGGAGTVGSGLVTSGGRSYFNYTSNPADTVPLENQMFANGGKSELDDAGSGGTAGWNGYTLPAGATKVTSAAVVDAGAGGVGASGNRGYGGCGGAGGYRGGPGNAGKGGGGGSFGRGGNPGNVGGAGGGGSGGIGGRGGDGTNGSDTTTSSGAGGYSGGSPQLSHAAVKLSNFQGALAQNCGQGVDSAATEGGSGGGAWCSAIAYVTPGQSYNYGAGVGGTGDNASMNGSYGIVVIEW